jgi:hypothetical protein
MAVPPRCWTPSCSSTHSVCPPLNGSAVVDLTARASAASAADRYSHPRFGPAARRRALSASLLSVHECVFGVLVMCLRFALSLWATNRLARLFDGARAQRDVFALSQIVGTRRERRPYHGLDRSLGTVEVILHRLRAGVPVARLEQREHL